ncbi:Sec1 family protein [Cardiosporidium cionae]|uniref:Sec1 family protein n=1 Tax=Cardiosporidium cionae TaxID=476202 RepID=A0ABQ7JB85_9APIC|nr:Sec1 family protein [Cardiosporidium cionae]|eukprot:KAF8821263.1 Sec1 family protein [Cardiosporidium cionae]
MNWDIQRMQRTALLQMLQLAPESPSSSTTPGGVAPSAEIASTWKILVYDEIGRDIIAPTLKVGILRQYGVTLHLLLESERKAVREVPAVYFISPTEKNIKRICEDFSKHLYKCYYINFTTSSNSEMIQMLAKGAVEAGAVHKVIRVVDRYLEYIALSPLDYSLNLSRSYSTLYGNLSDVLIEAFVEKVVGSLFCVISSLDVLPIIRCPSHQYSSAHMIAEKLVKRLEISQDRLESSNSSFSATLDTLIRPLLIILDRDIDLSVMLLHTWTYRALVHDVFGFRLGRVSIPLEISTKSTNSSSIMKSYDLDSNDLFWNQYGDSSFPQAAAAISDALNEYNVKMKDLKLHPSDDVDETMTNGFASAVNAISSLTEKKRSIDMHTNIATALVSIIKERSLDKYFELENEFESGAERSCISHLENLITLTEESSIEDKARALLCLLLYKRTMNPSQVQGIIDKLKDKGWNAAALQYLSLLRKYQNVGEDLLGMSGSGGINGGGGALNTLASASSTFIPSTAAAALGGLGYRFIDKGRDLLKDVKNLLPIQSNLQITRYVEALMGQKQSHLTDSFLYLDPKNKTFNSITPRVRSQFKEVIVFVVGGGNFVESREIRQLGKKYQKQIIYGSTNFVSPKEFLEELTELGSTWKTS